MHRFAIYLVVCGLTGAAWGAEPRSINVWPAAAPGHTGPELEERTEPPRPDENPPTTRLTNISRPSLAIYPADSSSGPTAAIIICPGGARRILAYDKEGTEVATWLQSQGVTALVLKYRVPAVDPKQPWLAAGQDCQRSISLCRAQARDWHIDPQRIGILGFSAGGEAAAVTTLAESRLYERMDATDDVSCRPDFAALIYPAYLITADKKKLRDDLQVTSKTPPLFLVHAANDGVSALNSVLLSQAALEAGVPVELHLYESGGHGFGKRPSSQAVSTWPDRLSGWLAARKIIPAR